MTRKAKGTENSFSSLLTDVEAEVSARLRRVLEGSRRQAARQGPDVRQMVAEVASLTLRGGKRLRATLCMLGGLCATARPAREPLLEAGVALELLQSYFLIHDDWMDGDALRRGGPTAHVALSSRLASTALGERAAILAGDHAVALAQLQLSLLSASPQRTVKAMQTFAAMQLDAVAGQQRDLVARPKGAELTYMLKTSSYTVTGPLVLGAELAGARPATIEALRTFGKPAGVAFQLRDDLLGAFGEPRVTGKPRGADLMAAKATPLLEHGRQLLTGAARKRLERVVGNRNASVKDVEVTLSDLERSGAATLVERRIERLRAQAARSLETRNITPQGRDLLSGALDRLLERHA
jgi:geranylgeranyl diphosphate synthase, type I